MVVDAQGRVGAGVTDTVGITATTANNNASMDGRIRANECNLVVQPRKVQEVRQWIDAAYSQPTHRLLLAKGPCGCGKTQTVIQLCKQANISLLEWIQPASFYSRDQDYVSALSSFRTFLHQSSHYPTLQSGSNRQLVLVKHVPFLASQEASVRFLQLLTTHIQARGKVPIVWVVSDGTYARDDRIGALVHRVAKLPRVESIDFNPITKVNLTALLKRVLGKRDMDLIDHIVTVCNGDVRMALNNAQFLGQRSLGSGLMQKERPGTLFQALGSILHKKRGDVLGVLDNLPVDGDMFVGYVQENYPSHCTTIEQLAHVAEYMSVADIHHSEYSGIVSCMGYTVTSGEDAQRGFVQSRKPAMWQARKEARDHRERLLSVLEQHPSLDTQTWSLALPSLAFQDSIAPDTRPFLTQLVTFSGYQ